MKLDYWRVVEAKLVANGAVAILEHTRTGLRIYRAYAPVYPKDDIPATGLLDMGGYTWKPQRNWRYAHAAIWIAYPEARDAETWDADETVLIVSNRKGTK